MVETRVLCYTNRTLYTCASTKFDADRRLMHYENKLEIFFEFRNKLSSFYPPDTF